jgi:hypothetical protein
LDWQARRSRCGAVEALLRSERHGRHGIIRLRDKYGEIAYGGNQPESYERNREAELSEHRRGITNIAKLRMQIAR